MSIWRLVTGNMGSGKSRFLIDLIENCKEYWEDKCVVFKPTIDTRTSGFISSRNGKEVAAIEVSNFADILLYVKDKEVKEIFIDEVQFLDSMGLRDLYVYSKIKGINVSASGLDLTSELMPWETTGNFNCYADNTIVVRGDCCKCGSYSRLSEYINGTKITNVEIGGDGEYIGVCEACHSQIGGRGNG